MNTTLFVNLNLFDGLHNEIKNDYWILVSNENGKILQLGSMNNNEPKNHHRIDLHGKYVMPGMVNCHTHVTLDPDKSDGDGWTDTVTATVRAIKHLKELLKSGVTYVRGCGSNKEMIDIKLSQAQQNGQLPLSPKIMPTGKPMTMTGGHGVLFHGGTVVDSPDEMRKAVRKNFAKGAQCTKVMATGGVMSVNDNMVQPQLKVTEMRVAVEETHSKGSIVAAHAEANPGIMNALKAGVDSIEHGFYVNNEEIDMMAQNKVYLTPTLSAGWNIIIHGDDLPAWELAKAEDCMEHGFQNFQKAYHKGVKLTLGTDAGCPYSYFDATPWEFELMVDKLGMSNFDALSTSRHSAELMKLEHYGTLEVGKYADFLTLDDNPLENIKAVGQKDKGVYQHGKQKF